MVAHVNLRGDPHVVAEAEIDYLASARAGLERWPTRSPTHDHAARATAASALQHRPRAVLECGDDGVDHGAGTPEILDGGPQRVVRPPLAGRHDDDCGITEWSPTPGSGRQGVEPLMTQPATAERFRSDPAATSAPAPSSRALIVDPLGDGRTRRFTDPAESWIDFWDRLIPPCATAARRPSASAASCPRANSAAESSFHRYGHTVIPASTATDTAVVVSTSTTTATTGPRSAAYDTNDSAPTGPHSTRTCRRPGSSTHARASSSSTSPAGAVRR